MNATAKATGWTPTLTTPVFTMLRMKVVTAKAANPSGAAFPHPVPAATVGPLSCRGTWDST